MGIGRNSPGLRRWLAGAVVAALLAGQVGPPARAVDDPARLLDDARYHFDFQEYRDAIDDLDRIADPEAVSAKFAFDVHILRGRCLVGLGNYDLARESFCTAHLLDREWSPDPDRFEPDEVEIFSSSLGDCQTGGGTPWGWIVAAGAVVAGVVVLLVGGGDDGGGAETTDLPDFPDMPAGPAKSGGGR